MKVVHLLESRFRSLLVEAMDINDIHTKYYSDIPYADYVYIVKSVDPTYDNVSGKMGKYAKWLLGMYRKGTFTRGDFGEARSMLIVFDQYKNRVQVRDVTQLHSMGELYQVVKPFMEGDQATSKSDEIRRTKQGAEKVYEDNKWLVIVPHTTEAAQLYGKHTKWCTAAEESDNMFEYYNSQGTLYINIDKLNNRKYQFHFETNQFMDEEDDRIDDPIFDTIGATNGLINFYENRVGIAILNMKLAYGVSVTSRQISRYKAAMEMINENEGYIIPNAYVVEDENDGKEAYVDENGNLLCGWFETCDEFPPVQASTEYEVTADVTAYATISHDALYNDDLKIWGLATYDVETGSVSVGKWTDQNDREVDAEWYEDKSLILGGYWYVDPDSVWDENDEWAEEDEEDW